MNHSGRIEQPLQILNNPSNNSSAKYQWSFSKSSRFPDKRGYTQTISYDLPSSRSTRKTSLGHGNRSKIFDGVNLAHPPPGLYSLASSFDNKK